MVRYSSKELLNKGAFEKKKDKTKYSMLCPFTNKMIHVTITKNSIILKQIQL
jgi:hypothetical protein